MRLAICLSLCLLFRGRPAVQKTSAPDLLRWRPLGAPVHKTLSSGRSAVVPTTLVCTKVVFDPYDRRHVVALGRNPGTFWHSRDTGRSWRRGGTGFPARSDGADVAFLDAKTMLVALNRADRFAGIMKTTDGGANWKLQSGLSYGLPEPNSPGRITCMLAQPDVEHGVLATIGGVVYQTLDAGAYWSAHDHGGPAPTPDFPQSGSSALPGRCLAVSIEPFSLFIATEKGIIRLDEEGYFQRLIGSPAAVTRMVTDKKGRLYALVPEGESGGLWRYAGERWTRLRSDRHISDVAVDPTTPGRIVVIANDAPARRAGAATGVWRSEDDGKTWTPQNDGLPHLGAVTITFNPHDPEQLVLGTQGVGVWTARWRKKTDR